MKSKVFSVTQINTYIKRMFQSDYALRRISIKGQVSNCKYHSSGHIYFSLKDEESQISCVMFASARYNGLQFELEDGQEVIVDGNVSVYERGGSYQLYAQEIRLNGIGELYVAYEMLKQNNSMDYGTLFICIRIIHHISGHQNCFLQPYRLIFFSHRFAVFYCNLLRTCSKSLQ